MSVGFEDIARPSAAGLQPDGKLVIAGLTVVQNRTAIRTALVRVLGDQPPADQGPGSPAPAVARSRAVARTQIARRRRWGA